MFPQATSIDFLKLTISCFVAVTKVDFLFYGSQCISFNRRVCSGMSDPVRKISLSGFVV